MDRNEAMRILQLFRPGTRDAEDPQVVEALQFAQQDEELAQWFAGHCSLYATMRNRLKEIPVPPDLHGSILRAATRRRAQIMDWRKWMMPLAAAAMITLLGVGSWLGIAHANEASFAGYRQRMEGLLERGYYMSMTSTNLADIHQYLVSNQCPEYNLPKPLAAVAAEGCAKLDWRNRKISMVCMRDHATNRALYLFAMERGQLRNGPTSSAPQFQQVRKLMTASWVEGDKVYVLAGEGSAAELRQYLN